MGVNTMRTAFIGLDYIIDIMHPQGKIARSAAHAQERDIIKKVNKVLEIAKLKNWLTIMVKVGFSAHYTEQPKHSPIFGKVHVLDALKLGSKGTEFHPELLIGNSLVMVKPRVSAFYGTALDAALRANQIERIILGESVLPGPCKAPLAMLMIVIIKYVLLKTFVRRRVRKNINFPSN